MVVALLRLIVGACALVCLALGAMGLQAKSPVPAPLPPPGASTTTAQHLAASPWWPTRPFAAKEAYAGTDACADCHDGIVQSQGKSQMAHTLTPAGDSPVLRAHPGQQYHSGPYTYTLRSLAGVVSEDVTDGGETRSAALGWAFGSGEIGQGYLWQASGGAFEEARFNYFSSFDGLAATPGRLHGAPTTLEMAVGRPMEAFEARTCFACHTTALPGDEPLDVHRIVPGVHCEACHGPGAAHIAAVSASGGPPDGKWDRRIVNSGRMSPAASVDFCGACHSTPADVRAMGAVGLSTVRFPAYRLEKSRCWGVAGDKRVTCIGCHDPHQPLVRDAAAYDRACLSCHATDAVHTPGANGPEAGDRKAGHPGAACPVATSRCTTCHMPKYELPEMHAKFTDHMIRVARPGAPFPD